MTIWHLVVSKLDSNDLTRGRMNANGRDSRELERKRQGVPRRARAYLHSERQHLGWSLKMSGASLSTLWYLGYWVQKKIFHFSVRAWKWSRLLGVVLRTVQSLILTKLPASVFWVTEDTSATLNPMKWQFRTALYKSKTSRWPLHIWHLSAIYLSKYDKSIWLMILSYFKLLVQCFF